MSPPLLDGLDALVGAALSERLVAALAAALAAAAGDPAHPLVARVRAAGRGGRPGAAHPDPPRPRTRPEVP